MVWILSSGDRDTEKPKRKRKRKQDGENQAAASKAKKRRASPCPDPEVSWKNPPEVQPAHAPSPPLVPMFLQVSGSEERPDSPSDSLDGTKKGERKKEFVCQVGRTQRGSPSLPRRAASRGGIKTL